MALVIGLCHEERGQLARCLGALGIRIAPALNEAAALQLLATGDVQFVFLGLGRPVGEVLRLVRDLLAAAPGEVPLLGLLTPDTPAADVAYVTAPLDAWLEWPADLTQVRQLLDSVAVAVAADQKAEAPDDEDDHEGHVLMLSAHPRFQRRIVPLEDAADMLSEAPSRPPEASAAVRRLLNDADLLLERLLEAAARVDVDAFHHMLSGLHSIATLIGADRLGALCNGWSGLSQAEIRQFGARHGGQIARELATIARAVPLDDGSFPHRA